MQFSSAERDRRWTEVRKVMDAHGVDVTVAFGDFGSISAHQRYLSGHRSIFEVEVVLLFSDGTCELVVAHPGVGALSHGLSWIDTEPALPSVPMSWPGGAQSDQMPSVGGEIANQIGRRGVTSIGVAGLGDMPASWKQAIETYVDGASFVDLGAALRGLRLRKSSEEVQFVRQAAHASNEAWAQLGEIIQPGRKRYEAMADIEHILRLNGCEDSYNLLLKLPMNPSEMDRYPYSEKEIEPGDALCVEISPRYDGYFAQQSGMVSVGPMPSDLQAAYDTLNRARDAGLAMMKPGVDLEEIMGVANAVLMDNAMTPVPFFTGHFVGLELEDQRTAEGSILLEEDMTLVFHPIAAEWPAVMRADTYVVTSSGVERLTNGSEASVEL